MSLKPPKKGDIKKKWLTKRIDRKIRIQPEYHLIITEGTATEPQYFMSMKDIINKKYRERIKLEIFGEGDNCILRSQPAGFAEQNGRIPFLNSRFITCLYNPILIKKIAI